MEGTGEVVQMEEEVSMLVGPVLPLAADVTPERE